MASVNLSITVETELVGDIAAELVLIQERLASRHGEAFRALDRRLEQVCGGELKGCFQFLDLEPGRLVAAPAGELLELVAEARRLGVI